MALAPPAVAVLLPMLVLLSVPVLAEAPDELLLFDGVEHAARAASATAPTASPAAHLPCTKQPPCCQEKGNEVLPRHINATGHIRECER
jgi:hypothetical protein